jgi:pimeloyl-ACP methyl ester carboxylesterase
MSIDRVPYDEFSYFADNASEYGIAYDGPPAVHRVAVPMDDGRTMSALVWQEPPPVFALLHGGAQNAHTWDTVALALHRPLIAVDLPGHGHSDGPGSGGHLSLPSNADDMAAVIRSLAPDGVHLVGMSLGGLTSIVLATRHPALVRSLTLVDITPGVTGRKAEAIRAFVNGPEQFPSFDELLERTIEFNPTRTVSSLRRGILHNAVQLDDGSWQWRYRRHGSPSPMADTTPEAPAATPQPSTDYGALWDALGAITVPVTLARGMSAQSVVDDADEAELLRRLPNATVVHFDHAGHSIQGDMPVELAALLASTPRRTS